MACQVVMGATLSCSFGAATSALVVLPAKRLLCEGVPAANIQDHLPLVNIAPFGTCSAPANPAVIAATAAAMGVPTPAPCVPVTVAPWAPGAARTLVAGQPALDNLSSCPCTWGGIVRIVAPGTVRTQVP